MGDGMFIVYWLLGFVGGCGFALFVWAQLELRRLRHG